MHVGVANEDVRRNGVDIAALEPRRHRVAVRLDELVPLELEIIRQDDQRDQAEDAEGNEKAAVAEHDASPEGNQADDRAPRHTPERRIASAVESSPAGPRLIHRIR